MQNTSRKCSINLLPDETLTQILKDVCGDELPSRKLGRVSKLWHNLLLGCSSFWRKVVILPLAPNDSAAVKRLSRRIELSKQALLDVSIDVRTKIYFPTQEDPRPNIRLFELLCDIDVSRWRSLNLQCDLYDNWTHLSHGAWAQLEKLQGSLKSLELLQFDRAERLPTQGRLYDLLLERAGTLRELRIVTCIPTPLANGRFLSSVARLVSLDGEVISRDAEPRRRFLQSWSQQTQIGLPLPSEIILARIPKDRLHLLDFSAVQSLEMSDGWIRCMSPLSVAVHLPLLSKLSLVNTLSDIKWLKAPLLTNLQVRGKWGSNTDKERKEEADRILRLFRDEPGEISMNILSLTIGIPISYQTLLKVFTHWNRLQHLTADISENAALFRNRSFAKEFVKAEQPTCPNLKTLTLRTRWGRKELDAWKETVETMFKQRASSGLQKVVWTYRVTFDTTHTIVRLPKETFTLF